MNTSEIKLMYNNFRNAETSKIDVRKIKDKLPANIEKMGYKKLNDCAVLLARVSREVSEGEFVKWFESDFKDLPPVKLNEREMELIQGGNLVNGAIFLGCVVVGICCVFFGAL
jgi:hypothetical protein